MPLDGSSSFDLPIAQPTQLPARRVLGLEAEEWGGFLVAFGIVLTLAGALGLATLHIFSG
jgi:hypothetical protein